MAGYTYLHVLEGRIRMRIPLLKHTPEKARELEKILFDTKGINEVKANHITGSVLIFFDSKMITHRRVLETIHTVGNVKDQRDIPVTKYPSRQKNTVTEFVVQKATEFALERLIFALI
jgi:predicted phosphatase